MHVVAVLRLTHYFAQPVAEVKAVRHPVPDRQIALHVVTQADRRRTLIITDVGQPVLRVVPVVVGFDASQVAADQVVQDDPDKPNPPKSD